MHQIGVVGSRLSCSFILRIVYSVLHIFVLLPHMANKLNHNQLKTYELLVAINNTEQH